MIIHNDKRKDIRLGQELSNVTEADVWALTNDSGWPEDMETIVKLVVAIVNDQKLPNLLELAESFERRTGCLALLERVAAIDGAYGPPRQPCAVFQEKGGLDLTHDRLISAFVLTFTARLMQDIAWTVNLSMRSYVKVSMAIKHADLDEVQAYATARIINAANREWFGV